MLTLLNSNKTIIFLIDFRQKEKSKQTDGSPLALFNMFIERTKEMLHIVLAMSPIGEAFRNRLRKFPSLISCCTIDWFQVITPSLKSCNYVESFLMFLFLFDKV